MAMSKSTSIATTVPKSLSATSRVRLIQNLETSQLLWLDQNVNEKQDNLMMQKKLQRTISTPKTFTNVRECEEYLRNSNNKDQKVVLILSDKFGRQLIPRIHALRQLSAFYVYCFDETSNKHWTEKYSKSKGVFDKSEKLIDQLKEDQRLRDRMDHTSVGMSVYRRKGLKERNAMFLHLQLFIEIILKMKSSNDRGKKELIQSLQQIYDGNDAQLSLVAEFERDYAPENAIWWYTRNTWLYPLLNKSLRSHDFDLLIPFQFFITDLYKQLAHEHQNFVSTVPTNSDPAFRIYRGQAIATEELNLIRESVGEFISMDSFLSTTTDRETGIAFANASVTGTEDDIKCILFELEIDTRLQNSKPFAAISHLSYFQNEEEVLIMLGCIFQIEEVKFNENLQMWMAKLIMRSADDYVLKPIFDYERKEFGNEPNLIHLARMLMNIDEYEKAKGILTQILNNSPTDLEARNCYFFLGSSARQQADYDTALTNYFKCLELQQKISSPDRPSMAQTFSSMAEVYYMKEQNDLSLEYCQKALDILPDDHEYRTRVYRQEGNVYLDKAEFILALDYYKKTLVLQERTLPKDHVEIGVTYNQIGTVYKEKHDYEMALQYYEGSLTILQKTLPSSHKLIKKAESNIQTVNNLKNNAKTLATDPSS